MVDGLGLNVERVGLLVSLPFHAPVCHDVQGYILTERQLVRLLRRNCGCCSTVVCAYPFMFIIPQIYALHEVVRNANVLSTGKV